MSTILKALRRLEEERDVQEERPLREQVAAPRAAAPRGMARPLTSLALILGVGVGAGVLAFWSAQRDAKAPAASEASTPRVASSRPAEPAPAAPAPLPPAPVEPTPAPELAGPDPGAALLPEPAPEPERRELPSGALASRVEVVRRPPPEPRIVDSEPAVVEPSAAVPTSVATRPKVPAASPPPPRSARSAPRERTSSVAAQRPAPARPAAPPPKPRAVTPGVHVERTVWHPVSDRRVAVVALDGAGGPREIREGDAVGSLVVSEIEPSGVVFLHQGVELRRRVGD
jgi:hypothetical protein